MATEETVEAPTTETLERIDAFLKDPEAAGELPQRQRPQRQLEEEPEPEVHPIVAALVKERLVRGLTQDEVAQRIGLASAALLKRLESGEVDFPLSVLHSWSQALGITFQARQTRRRGRPPKSYR